MRTPRFRSTVRRMMLAVAVAGLICGGEVLRRRRAAFAERATMLRWSEYVERLGAHRPAVADHRDRLARKYERAARQPWLPVAPDPPEPE